MAVTPGIPRSAETVSDSLLTGKLTPVNPEQRFTIVIASSPQSIDSITARTG